MTDDAERTKVITKVRRLLALADSKGSTDEERQNATAKAAAIMAKHDLTEAIIRAEQGHQPEPIELWDFPVSGRGRIGRERAWALGDIAAAYGAEVCFRNNQAHNQIRYVRIVATHSDLEALKILLPIICTQMETSAAAAARRHGAELRNQWWLEEADRRRELLSFSRTYMRGYGTAIANKIATHRETITEDLATTSDERALVLVDRDQRVHAEFLRRFPKLRKPRATKHHSAAGWQAGHQDGHQDGDRSGFGDKPISGHTRPAIDNDQ